MEISLLSPKAVCEQTSLSRTTLDRMVTEGEFPSPIRITQRRLAFRKSDVTAWLAKVAA